MFSKSKAVVKSLIACFLSASSKSNSLFNCADSNLTICACVSASISAASASANWSFISLLSSSVLATCKAKSNVSLSCSANLTALSANSSFAKLTKSSAFFLATYDCVVSSAIFCCVSSMRVNCALSTVKSWFNLRKSFCASISLFEAFTAATTALAVSLYTLTALAPKS